MVCLLLLFEDHGWFGDSFAVDLGLNCGFVNVCAKVGPRRIVVVFLQVTSFRIGFGVVGVLFL